MQDETANNAKELNGVNPETENKKDGKHKPKTSKKAERAISDDIVRVDGDGDLVVYREG